MSDQQSRLKAALWMAGSIASFLLMSIAGRALTPTLNVFQIMEMRSVVGFVILLPLVVAAGGLKAMRTSRLPLHIARNLAHYSGQLAWLYALTLIPLAELVAIEFTTPIWTALFAVTILGERLTRPRTLAIVLGLVGVLVIVRPGATALEPGHLFVLFAALTFGISFVMVKSLTGTESAVRIIFWMLVLQSAFGLLPALYVWRTPSADLIPWILLIGLTGMSSHFCLTRALGHADATIVAPMDFSRLPLAAVIGWALYSETIGLWTAVGAALILSGNLLNIQRRAPAVETV